MKFINVLHTLANTLLPFLCSETHDLTEREQKHMENFTYCNHKYFSFYLPKKLKEAWYDLQKCCPCHSSKEAVKFHVNTVLGKKIQVLTIL